MIWTLLISLLVIIQQPANEQKADSSKFEPVALGMKVPVLTEKDDLDKYVGRLVAVRGIPTLTKQHHIAGIDVDADYDLAKNKVDCYAVGILSKWVVKPEVVNKGVIVAGRGAGTFYTLYSDLKGTIAKAEPVNAKKK
jgi:hypothetical protein